MRIVGVRLNTGRAVWLDAGELSVTPLDRATAQVDGSNQEGEVFVAPHQVWAPPERIDGLLLASQPPVLADDDCDHIPGAELPALGQAVQWGDIHGVVVELDPVEKLVTIAHQGDERTVVPLSDISGG